MGSAVQPEREGKKLGVCSLCAKPSTSTICEQCEARIRGELLDEKQRVEKAGHTPRI